MRDRWSETTLRVPGMDCSSEEQLVRTALDAVPTVADLAFDLPGRRLTVVHEGPVAPVLAAVEELGLGARVLASAPAAAPDRPQQPGDPAAERRVLQAVLALNAAMFGVELAAGVWAQSTGLVADSLDMLADAGVYGLALAAVSGVRVSRRQSARASGWLQLALGLVVLLDVGRRVVEGSEPRGAVMVAVGVLALLANVTCVALLGRHRNSGVHLRASWIFSTNDALANLGVIVAGQLVAVLGSPWPDLLIGTAIAALVASGGWRILRMAR